MPLQNRQDPRKATPGDEFRRETQLQPDPELQEGPAGGGRIAIYVVAIVVLLGAVFFGLNSSPTATATSPAASPSVGTAPAPAIRDVTPNRQSGTTTGAAPAQPIEPPQSKPTGTQIDETKGSGR